MRFSRMLTVVGCHAEGEVGNVVTGGMVPLKGDTVFEMRCDMEANHDDIRKLLLFEPRGSAVQNHNVIVPARHPDAQAGYIILEATEYPVMSGSNTICVATVLLESGMLEMTEPETHLTLESPAGLIHLTCACENGKVRSVKFLNQPAFPYLLDQPLDVAGIGSLTVDIAFGGMTFVLVDAEQIGVAVAPENGRKLAEAGRAIVDAAAAAFETVHPENPGFPGITIGTICGPLEETPDGLRSANATVVLPGRLDRSPCGTATCARMAVLHAKGFLKPGQTFEHLSAIGTTFIGRIEDETKVGPYDAIVPSISGQAWITYMSQHGLDPTDPFPAGHTPGDMWFTPE